MPEHSPTRGDAILKIRHSGKVAVVVVGKGRIGSEFGYEPSKAEEIALRETDRGATLWADLGDGPALFYSATPSRHPGA